MAKRSNLSIPTGWANQDRRFAESVKENLDVLVGHRGDKLDRAVTFRDLLDAGVIKLARGMTNFDGRSSSIATQDDIPNLDIPPAPTNLQASGAFRNIILTWNLKLYGGHSAVQVFRHTSDAIASATMIAQVSGFTGIYSDEVGPGQTLYYWVRAVNQNDVLGPFNSSTGTSGTTSPDVTFLRSALATAIRTSELAEELSDPIGKLPADTQAEITANENAIIDINNVSQGSNSAAATAIRAVNSILYDNPAGTGNSVVSALALTRMKTQVLDVNGVATATAEEMKFLSSDYTNPETGVTDNVTLKQALNTSASNVNGLRGQYSVKIDTNGHVAGFGFSSTLVGDTPSSAFIVNAEKFAIVSPTDTSSPTNSPNTNNVPFIVQSSATTLNGVAVPAGVYIKDLFVKNGSIVNAKIGNAAIDDAKVASLSATKLTAGKVNTSLLNIDGATLTSEIQGGVSVLRINALGVNDAHIANLSATKLNAGTLTVYNAAASNTMGKLFTVTSGYTATTAYNTNSTTNMSYASVASDWHDGTYNNPWHYNNTAGTTMPGLLIDGSASGNNFTIPDVEGNQTHVEVSVHFGTNPVGTFNGDETSFCVCHLQRADSSINNTGAYNTNTQVWGGSVVSTNTNMALVPRYGVFTASLNPGTWYVWLFAWSRKADTSSSGQHGFSDSFVHVNSFYR